MLIIVDELPLVGCKIDTRRRGLGLTDATPPRHQDEKAEVKPTVEAEKKPEGYSFPEAVWQSLMHSIDAGTVAGDASVASRSAAA